MQYGIGYGESTSALMLTIAHTNGVAVKAGALPITQRQYDVLRLVAHGWNYLQISQRLCISPRTVSSHLLAAYERLGVVSAAQAVAMLVSTGIIEYDPTLAVDRYSPERRQP